MTPAGLERLKQDEGCRLQAYPDPLSGGKPYTIGYGCTGAGIGPGVVWTQTQADTELTGRVGSTEAALKSVLPSWFASLDPVRRDVLVNIAFNIGVTGLTHWPVTLADVGKGSYAAAADEIAGNTVWKKQVGARADRCAAAMRTGNWS
jgi:lysozyme